MQNMKIEAVAKSWVEMWSYEIEAPERDKYDWVEDFEYEAIYENPETGLKLVLAVLELGPNLETIEVLAAGPLEDLLAQHGGTLISKIEVEAKNNQKFASLLGGVWQNAISNEVWERVQKVWNRKGWDGNS